MQEGRSQSKGNLRHQRKARLRSKTMRLVFMVIGCTLVSIYIPIAAKINQDGLNFFIELNQRYRLPFSCSLVFFFYVIT